MKQHATRLVKISTILNRAAFGRGIADKMAGRGWPPEYETWGSTEKMTYERGRQYAAANGVMPIKRGRAVRREACQCYAQLRADRTLL